MNRQEAEHRLHILLVATSVKRSLEHLQNCLESFLLLKLYRHFFPREFSQSQEPFTLASYGLGPRELEFLHLVEDQLFPLNSWWVDLLLEEGERPVVIPVDPGGLELWDMDFTTADWPLSIRVMAALVWGVHDDRDWPTLLAHIHGAPWPATAAGIATYEFDEGKFKRLCRRAGGWMAKVPLVMDYVAHETGNFWLDTPEWEGQDYWPPWDVDTIQSLAVQWTAAKKLFSTYDQVMAWLDDNPGQLARLIAFWNRSCKLTPLSDD